MAKTATADDLPLLERRRLEAGVLVPLIRAFQAEFGEGAVNPIVARVIQEIARAQGEAQRAAASVNTVADMRARFGQGGPVSEGSLIVDVVPGDEDHFGFNVTECKFVGMYREMGAGDLGFLLSCNRDFASFQGMAPGLTFERTQTRMQGASHCDFRYSRPAS
jgi:predicted ArsR family transcriptional regulator